MEDTAECHKTNEREALRREVMSDCKMFYSEMRLPMSMGCACWGWEFGYGWDRVAADMSYELEMLNLEAWPRWRARVVMEQMKEKFGELTVYWRVQACPGPVRMALCSAALAASKWLGRADFKMVRKVLEPEWQSVERTELSQEEWDARKQAAPSSHASSERLVEEDGKLWAEREVLHLAKTSFKPSAHLLRWKLWKLAERLAFVPEAKETAELRAVKRALEARAEEIVQRYEAKAFETCEHCGTSIGCSWSPRCCTSGWVSCLCEDCAKKTGRKYSTDFGKR